MASAGDGERPRLPDTDDPFVLLGIEHGADTRTIRQAYARLIRIYRPDRAPREFQRIHAAFEEVQRSESLWLELGKLCAEAEPPADEASGSASSSAEPPVGASPDGADPDGTEAAWELAWRAAYEHDLGHARALLDDDRLRLDSADDPRLAVLCMLRIGALAWKGVDVAKLLDAYRAAIPAHPVLDDLLAAIELDVAAAASLRNTPPHAARWIDPMRELLAAGRLGDLDRCRAAARAVMAILERDLDATLRDLDELHDALDLGPLFEAIYAQLPLGATRLDALDKDVFDRVTLALHELGRDPHKWTAVGGALGVTALAGATCGLGLGLAVLAGAVGAFVGTEKRRYRRNIRPGLARMLLRTPVTTWVLSRWVRINGRLAGRLWRFDMAIDADRALYALSMLAAAAIAIGELDEAVHAAD